ncbi:PREDICTED: uncharacterized protein LOC108561865 isoform X2 [Nicrophorus vespilloides]|uniref:Uncharacterized protein LOC108561865 isoform X2 n=1 Tax=Nicrophorus vespilloides TaxID=110193 RepID=A0ABM1MLK9_NICVS|nr:PREDICTED: uncharacterized protein LOC108561865 isoform X2 [Nicrophorus vespilloides]
MQLFRIFNYFALCLLCFPLALGSLGLSETYCEKTLDCNGPNTLCIKNRCICIKSHKWDEEGYECGIDFTTESPEQNKSEPDVVKVHVQDDKKVPISFYKSASFFASYTFIISCVIISIFTCYLKILAVRRWQMRLREIRHINSYV